MWCPSSEASSWFGWSATRLVFVGLVNPTNISLRGSLWRLTNYGKIHHFHMGPSTISTGPWLPVCFLYVKTRPGITLVSRPQTCFLSAESVEGAGKDGMGSAVVERYEGRRSERCPHDVLNVSCPSMSIQTRHVNGFGICQLRHEFMIIYGHRKAYLWALTISISSIIAH